jgi:hypothetical protein
MGSQLSEDKVWLTGLVILPLFIIYYCLFESLWQRTPGKFLTGTKVVNLDGSKPSFLRILGRSFARYIPFDNLSFLFMTRGWHDYLSKTLVVPKSYTALEISRIDLNKQSKTNGWLIALVAFLIFIAIGGVIASVVLVSLNSARVKSRDATRVANIRQIQGYVELAATEINAYPSTLDGLMVYGEPAEIPVAPTPADGECTLDENEYSYTSDGKNYELSFCLGNATGGFPAGFNTVSSDVPFDSPILTQ